MLNAEFVDRIVGLASNPEVTVGGHTYTARGLKLVENPTPKPVVFHTLDGLTLFVKHDLGMGEKVYCHVDAPDSVTVFSYRDDKQQRKTLATASPYPVLPGLNQFHSQEQFIILLQACFVPTETRARLLKIVGNLTADVVHTSEDDGVTQRVSVKAGVALKEREDLPSPVRLAPYRTFSEVEQPESDFVLRVNNTRGLQLALFEADGGAWRVEAAKRVCEYLTERYEALEINGDGLDVLS